MENSAISPSYYQVNPNGCQVIDISETLNFCRGNVVKYVAREIGRASCRERV